MAKKRRQPRTPEPSLFPKVFDASSLISFEKAKRMDILRARCSEVVVPDQLVRDDALLARESPVKRFLSKHREVMLHLTAAEERRRLELLKVSGIDKGEAAALAMAEGRKMPLVINDGAARKAARSLGIRCLGWKEFVDGST